MNEQPEEIHTWSTGIRQFVDGSTMPEKNNKFEDYLQYCTKSEIHMWNSTVMFYHTQETIETMRDGEPLNLDSENLMLHMVGCFICEEPYSAFLVRRKCKGQKKGNLKYI